MSHIVRTGNLTETPTLRQGKNGPYTYARVAVSLRGQAVTIDRDAEPGEAAS